MLCSQGTLLVTHERMTRRVVNRLGPPGNGDILVPGGTVSILGTTSVTIDDPDAARPTVAEADENLRQALPMIPSLAYTRFVRAYCGVRPLISAGGGDGRTVSRGFMLYDHAEAGLSNFCSVSGGKLTTFRLMAEKTADLVCARLGVGAPCRTRTEPLPAAPACRWTEPGFAPRLWAQRPAADDPLLCECEMVPASAVDGSMNDCGQQFPDPGLQALGKRSRIGKGSCQGAFCGVRVAAHLYDTGTTPPPRACADARILHRALQGPAPVLWGPQLIQAELAEALHCGLLGLELTIPHPAPQERPMRPVRPGTGRPGHEPDPALRSGRRRHRAGGMAAAVFASARGCPWSRRAAPGQSYTSGVFDVLGALPAMAEGQPARPVERPFEALAALLRDEPGHPYALLDPEDIRLAFHEVMDFLREAGLPYRAGGETNFLLPTPAGTLKHSWCVPETTLPGCEALAEGTPTCIVAFEGMKGFSARQVAANLGPRWPGLTTARVAMPGHPGGEVYPEQVARMLEVPAARRALAGPWRPWWAGRGWVGLPAVLGMHRPGDVAADMTPPAGPPGVRNSDHAPGGVPGIRLKETFEGLLPGARGGPVLPAEARRPVARPGAALPPARHGSARGARGAGRPGAPVQRAFSWAAGWAGCAGGASPRRSSACRAQPRTAPTGTARTTWTRAATACTAQGCGWTPPCGLWARRHSGPRGALRRRVHPRRAGLDSHEMRRRSGHRHGLQGRADHGPGALNRFFACVEGGAAGPRRC
jgi:hypothetical protein